MAKIDVHNLRITEELYRKSDVRFSVFEQKNKPTIFNILFHFSVRIRNVSVLFSQFGQLNTS